MNLRELQAEIELRWGSDSYKASVQHADHAALHLMKALGKISAMLEQTHHTNGENQDVSPQIADLVICSARLASLLSLDLKTTVEKRLAEKFPPRSPRLCEGCGTVLLQDHIAVYCTNECAVADA